MKTIEFSRANEILSYDPDTGYMTWKFRSADQKFWNGRWAGRKVGFVSEAGYVMLQIKRQYFMAHRIAFLLMTGEMPTDLIDHIDGNRSNNAWSNLRHATRTQNNANRKMFSNNTSGYRGVTWNKRERKWVVSLSVDGTKVHLGYFTDITEAASAYAAASLKYHGEYANDGHGALIVRK